MQELRRNITLFYAQRFLNEFFLIAPILIPYYQLHRFGMRAFFTAQAIYALTVFLMEVPSGYMADVIGRKRTLVLGALIFPVGLLLYALTDSLWGFFLAEFLVAVGNSMRTGCDSALLYDTLLSLDAAGDYSVREGKGHFYARIGTGVASVGGGLLAMVSLYLPFWINFFVAALAVPVNLAMREPPRHRPVSRNPMKEILTISTATLLDRKLRPLILYSGLLMAVSVIALWAYFIFYQRVGIPLGLFGLLFALFQFSGALGARSSSALALKWGGGRSVCLSLGLGGILVILGLLQSPLMLVLIMLHPLLWNIAIPLLFDQINRRTDSGIRATILSLASMGHSLGYVIAGPWFGLLIDSLPLPRVFFVLALCFSVPAAFLLFKIKRDWLEVANRPLREDNPAQPLL